MLKGKLIGWAIAALVVGGSLGTAGYVAVQRQQNQSGYNMMGGNGSSTGYNMMGNRNGNGSSTGYNMMGNGNGNGNGNGYGMMGGYGNQNTTTGTPVAGISQMNIQNFAFQYPNIQVKVGTTVTWTNLDTVPHTVTFTNGMKDSGNMAKGATFSYTFSTQGTYTYYCEYHPYMKAQVTVTQ